MLPLVLHLLSRSRYKTVDWGGMLFLAMPGDARQSTLESRAKVIVHEVSEAALNAPPPASDELFRSTYATLPDSLLKQMRTRRTDSIGQDPEQIGLKARPQPAESNGVHHAAT